MDVHPAAVIPKEGLGHEGDGLAVLIRHIADDVLVQHHVVGRFEERVEALVNFALSRRGDFVVMALNHQTAALHGGDHFGAQVLVMIGRRHREVAFFEAGPVAEVVFLAA